MYVYLVSEECHGLLGVFSNEENCITFLKTKWGLKDNFESTILDEKYIEIWNPDEGDGYFIIEKKEVDNPNF